MAGSLAPDSTPLGLVLLFPAGRRVVATAKAGPGETASNEQRRGAQPYLETTVSLSPGKSVSSQLEISIHVLNPLILNRVFRDDTRRVHAICPLDSGAARFPAIANFVYRVYTSFHPIDSTNARNNVLFFLLFFPFLSLPHPSSLSLSLSLIFCFYFLFVFHTYVSRRTTRSNEKFDLSRTDAIC